MAHISKFFQPLVFLVSLAFVLRLYQLQTPLADWHSFRQADTASVTREYVKHSIDLLRPRYHDLSNIQSGLDNLDGWRMVEFPFINAGIAMILKTLPFLPLVPTSRMISIIFSLLTLISIYYLVKNLSGKKTAYLAAFIFSVLPYSVYYSRTVLPEPGMLFFSTFSILSFYYWVRRGEWKWYLLSATSLSLALLLKPFVIFTALVYLIIFFFYKKNFRVTRLPNYLVTLLPFLLSLFPLYLWRQWIIQFPSGIPASDWLFNSDLIRFRPAWFRWLFYERIAKLILGFFGVMFLPLAFIKIKKDTLVYAAWWIGMIIYMSVLATGNVRHDYYQILLTPIICISVAKGSTWLLDFLKVKFSHQTSVSILGFIYLLMLTFSWQQVKGYFNINHWEYVKAGRAVDKLLPPNAKVIASGNGDTTFLFQTNRTGWPIGVDIEEKIQLGAEYFVTTSYDNVARELEKRYEIIEKTDEFLIFNLRSQYLK